MRISIVLDLDWLDLGHRASRRHPLPAARLPVQRSCAIGIDSAASSPGVRHEFRSYQRLRPWGAIAPSDFTMTLRASANTLTVATDLLEAA